MAGVWRAALQTRQFQELDGGLEVRREDGAAVWKVLMRPAGRESRREDFDEVWSVVWSSIETRRGGDW